MSVYMPVFALLLLSMTYSAFCKPDLGQFGERLLNDFFHKFEAVEWYCVDRFLAVSRSWSRDAAGRVGKS